MKIKDDGLREKIKFSLIEEKETDIEYLTKLCKNEI